MAALSWSSLGMLRRQVSLRGVFVWLLLALLLAGAASYTYGSRYAIVHGHGPVQSAAGQGLERVPPQPETTASRSDTPASASQAVRVVHEAGPSVEPEELEKDCCERNKAPRGEPVPVRTGAVDPPSLTHRLPGDAILAGNVPPEPGLPALKVVELSISRT
ncbi:hypothetical protein [Arthrobacter sp. B6]|uniref:hypothetical protein n=1 Tax=Arthrobacter sp. B6 TaxID=1570137 RepID=UPI000831EB61|nr:hypothetical protein [Arthrobacter sp. B6]